MTENLTLTDTSVDVHDKLEMLTKNNIKTIEDNVSLQYAKVFMENISKVPDTIIRPIYINTDPNIATFTIARTHEQSIINKIASIVVLTPDMNVDDGVYYVSYYLILNIMINFSPEQIQYINDNLTEMKLKTTEVTGGFWRLEMVTTQSGKDEIQIYTNFIVPNQCRDSISEFINAFIKPDIIHAFLRSWIPLLPDTK